MWSSNRPHLYMAGGVGKAIAQLTPIAASLSATIVILGDGARKAALEMGQDKGEMTVDPNSSLAGCSSVAPALLLVNYS